MSDSSCNSVSSRSIPPTARRAIGPSSQSNQRIPNIISACDTCRRRKTKCSGDRPACKSCSQRNVLCIYQTNSTETRPQALKRKYEEVRHRSTHYEELFQLLKDLPDNEAQRVLKHIRAGADIETIHTLLQSGNIHIQMTPTPETRLRNEFPYESEMPQDLLFDNLHLNSLIYQASSLYPSTTAPWPVQDESTASEHQTAHLEPFHAAEIVDPLIDRAKPSKWTSVSNDDALMRDMLRTYFRCEYPTKPVFQKDYFLEDMATGSNLCCSSLLVNIVLAYACLCYTKFQDGVEYWNPKTLTFLFFAEARRLWELEAEIPRITTVQADIMLYIFYFECGQGQVGSAYFDHGLKLAQQLHLCEANEDVMSEREKAARDYTAWTVYYFDTLVASVFLRPPVFTRPQVAPLPDPSHYARWYGESWLKYPLSHVLLPIHIGYTRHRTFRLFEILNRFCQAAYAEGKKLTLDEAYEFYSQLTNWFDKLPDALTPKFMVHPAHFQLHIQYQQAILTLYEPFLAIAPPPEHQTLSPEVIYRKAYNELQTLIRVYFLRHGFNSTNIGLCQPLAKLGFITLQLVNMQLSAAELEATRSMLHDQSLNSYLSMTIYLTVKSQMQKEEASLLDSTLGPFEGRKKLEEQTMLATIIPQWPIMIATSSEDSETNRALQLAEWLVAANITREPQSQAESSERLMPSGSSARMSIKSLIN